MTNEEIEQLHSQVEAENTKGNFVQAKEICHAILAKLERAHSDFLPKGEELSTGELRAKTLLQLARTNFELGNFEGAFSVANSVLSEAETFSSPEKHRWFSARAHRFLGIIHTQHSEWTLALEHLQKALALDEQGNDKDGIATDFGSIGNFHKERGEYADALEYYQKALALNEEIGNAFGVETNLGNIGNVHIHLSDYANALSFLQKSLAIAQERGNKSSVARQLGNIGLVYAYLSDCSRALEYYQKSLALNEEIGREVGVAINFANIGIIYNQLLEYPLALEYYQKALAMYEKIGFTTGIASVLGNIGGTYSSLLNYPLALEYQEKALAICETLGNKEGVAMNLGNIGIIYFELLDYSRAMECMQKSLALFEEVGVRNGEVRMLGSIGSVFALEKFSGHDAEKAKAFLLKAIALGEEISDKRDIFPFHKNLADLYKTEKCWEEYSYHLEKFYEIRDEIQSEESKKQARKFDFDRAESEREKLLIAERADTEATNRALQKFLPDAIIPMAKSGKLVVEKFDSVAILFADLVGFTPLSTKIPPTVMIELLNFVFTHFDSIVKKHGGHRLRTMGDGYFAIVGAPDRIKNPTLRMAKIALEMQEDFVLPKEISQYLPEKTEFEVRIGLNCGEAVCGLVGGGNRWQYDAYGDAINTAARMESHGEAGKIHCTEEFVKNLTQTLSEGEGLKIIPLSFGEGQGVRFVPRGEIEVKGKGKMRTYFLEKAV